MIGINGLRHLSAGHNKAKPLTPGNRKTSYNIEVLFQHGLEGSEAIVDTMRLGNGDARCTLNIVVGGNELAVSLKMRNTSAWVRVVERTSFANMEVFMGDDFPPEPNGNAVALLKITDLNTQANSESDEDEKEQFFEIFVKLFNGKSTTYRVCSEMLVKDLKEKIQGKTQFPPDQQRLIYQGKQLEDNRSLGFYNVKANETMNLVSRLRGG